MGASSADATQCPADGSTGRSPNLHTRIILRPVVGITSLQRTLIPLFRIEFVA